MIVLPACERAAEEPEERPAEFEASSLVITPAEVQVGEQVTIKLDVTNTGDGEGIYQATLLLNGEAVETKEVEIVGGEKVAVSFTLVKDVAGTYNLEVNGLSGRLTVLSPAEPELTSATFEVSSLSITPAKAGLGQLVTVTANVKNVGDVEGTYTACLIIEGVEVARKEVLIAAGMMQTVTFNITKDAAGSYNIQIGKQSHILTVEALSLSSPAFEEGDEIPVKYTGDGQDISPPLEWTEPPAGTQSFALIVDDPDAPGGVWTHWVIFNLPSDSRELLEAIPTSQQLASGALQGRNDFGDIGYGGPAPPRGTIHHYEFTLYALDQHLDLAAGVTKTQLLTAMEGHTLAQAQLIGTYQR